MRGHQKFLKLISHFYCYCRYVECLYVSLKIETFQEHVHNYCLFILNISKKIFVICHDVRHLFEKIVTTIDTLFVRITHNDNDKTFECL